MKNAPETKQHRLRASSRPLRVVWEMRYAARNRTGTGVLVSQLLRGMERESWIKIIPVQGWDPFKRGSGALARIGRLLLDALWIHVLLPARLLSLRPDLLHAQVMIAPIWGRTPLVVTFYDLIFAKFPHHYKRWWVIYLNWLTPRVLRRAKAVIAISEASKQDAVQVYGIDPAKVHVVYPGVDHDRFNPNAAVGAGTIVARLGIHAPYVLTVGSLSTRKNIPLLLEAVALLKVRNQWQGRQVVLVGAASPGMPGVEAIHEAVRKLGLQDDVVFADHVSDGDLPGIYARAAVLAFPSLYEGFGLPVVEAMACGVPVIAANNSSLIEVVADAGIVVKGNDAAAFAESLHRLLEDEGLRADLRARGISHAAQFTWDSATEQLLAVYRRVVVQGR